MLVTLHIAIGKYFTDGNRLYRILKVHGDNTVTVENCSTLFSTRISKDTVYEGWTEVTPS